MGNNRGRRLFGGGHLAGIVLVLEAVTVAVWVTISKRKMNTKNAGK
jgi:hypothetical protein